jgi:hypothetical protein
MVIAAMVSALVTSAVAQSSLTIATTNTLSAFSLTSDPTASQTLNVRTSWSVFFGYNLTVCVYMNAPMTGTAGNVATIPASSVRVNQASIVKAGTNCGVPTATLIGTKSWWLGSGSMSNAIAIDIASYSASLPPDTYTGTINLVATAQ